MSLRSRTFLLSLFAAIFVLCSFTIVYAVEDQFEINLTVTSSDATPPSQPTGLSATAVSTSQINLSWTASTDNVAVTGYRIYRGNSFVGTSVATSYSDTGLSSATAYDYTVSAVDAASNESLRSATSSATTFSPASAGGGGGGSGQYKIPQIYNLAVVPGQYGATVSWNTTDPTVSTLSWGLTNGYELGALSGIIFDTVHQVTIPNLIPGTQYFFSISVMSGYGVNNNLPNQSFVTLPLPQGNLNPRNFVAIPEADLIRLKWNNPTDPNFSEVRVVKNKNFFPSDPNDGEVIYEGQEEMFLDRDVVVGTRYYYALFAKDSSGNYSSGLLAQGRISRPGEPIETEEEIIDGLPQAPSVHPLINSLSFLDFDFIQNGKKISNFSQGNAVTIDGTKNLTVSLDYQKVPEILKSIVVTLTHPTNPTRSFSFLLRVNKEKTAYTATIGALGESGKYGVKISIVDYKNRGLKKIVGDLFASAVTAFDREKNLFQTILTMLLENVLNLILLLVLLIIFSKSLKTVLERKHKKQTHNSDKNSNA